MESRFGLPDTLKIGDASLKEIEMEEWALFQDSEGAECFEGGFYSREEALAALAERYSEEEGVRAAVVCSEHPDFEREHCEECNGEEEEPEEGEEEEEDDE